MLTGLSSEELLQENRGAQNVLEIERLQRPDKISHHAGKPEHATTPEPPTRPRTPTTLPSVSSHLFPSLPSVSFTFTSQRCACYCPNGHLAELPVVFYGLFLLRVLYGHFIKAFPIVSCLLDSFLTGVKRTTSVIRTK